MRIAGLALCAVLVTAGCTATSGGGNAPHHHAAHHHHAAAEHHASHKNRHAHHATHPSHVRHTAAPPPAQHSCTRTSSGSCIQGGEFCPDASEGTYGYDANGDRYICRDGHWEIP